MRTARRENRLPVCPFLQPRLICTNARSIYLFLSSFFQFISCMIISETLSSPCTNIMGVYNYDSWTSLIISTLCTIIPAVLSVIVHLLRGPQQPLEPEGCKRLGIPKAKSNLSDEHKECYHQGSQKPQVNSSGKSSWSVKSILIYPVKSCRGVELDQSKVVRVGMQYDRNFALAQLKGTFPASADISGPEKSAYKWRFITQRERPQMARVRTEIWVPDPASTAYSSHHPNIQSEGVLVVKFPIEHGYWGWLSDIFVRWGGNPYEHTMQFPLNPTPDQIKSNGYTTEKMTIWKESPDSLLIERTSPESEQTNPTFKNLSRFLGVSNSLALFRASRNPNREVYRCAPRKSELGYQSQVAFQDAYPLHLINLSSVREVESRLPSNKLAKIKNKHLLTTIRFRPNIIITGPEPYAEDAWKVIALGGFKYHVSCRTARCTLPNIDPTSGVKDTKMQPYRTLEKYRAIDPGAGKLPCLGMQMVPKSEEGVVRVGDEVKVLESGEHFYLMQ